MKPKGFFLHVGYAKAGSSLTGDWLEKNPAFCFSDFSIGGLRNTADLMHIASKNVTEQPQYYVIRDMMFTIPRYDDGDFSKVGELKNYQKEVCNLLAALFPSAKVLIITRGYKSIISANYSQHVREGGTVKAENILKFSGFIQDLFDYSYLINLYKSAFGEKNIIVLPYEFLKDNSSSFFKKIEEELDLEHFNFTSKIVNPSLNPDEAQYFLKINSLVDFFARNSGKPGKRLRDWYIKKRRREAFEEPSGKQVLQERTTNEPLIHVPEDLFLNLRKNSYLLKEYPIFNNYSSFY